MSCEVCQLKELAFLHTVLVRRALGLVRLKDIDLQLREITYICLSVLRGQKQTGHMPLLGAVVRKFECGATPKRAFGQVSFSQSSGLILEIIKFVNEKKDNTKP